MSSGEVRLLVFGGRTYAFRAFVHEAILQIIDGVAFTDITIIHGDCPEGTDAHAHAFYEQWKGWGLQEARFPAAWDDTLVRGAALRQRNGRPYNMLAGFQRNQRMLDKGNPTHALGTPGGNGTADMRQRIEAANKNGASITLRMIE